MVGQTTKIARDKATAGNTVYKSYAGSFLHHKFCK